MIRAMQLQKEIPSFYHVHCFEQLGSTNTWLMEHTDMEEGTVIIADEQTGGKGRNGRHYHSPKGSGIYLSLLLKPDGALHDVLSLTAATAVACLKAIEEVYGLACSIKWLNDILYEGKKISGILCEGKMMAGKDVMQEVVHVHMDDGVAHTAENAAILVPPHSLLSRVLTGDGAAHVMPSIADASCERGEYAFDAGPVGLPVEEDDGVVGSVARVGFDAMPVQRLGELADDDGRGGTVIADVDDTRVCIDLRHDLSFSSPRGFRRIASRTGVRRPRILWCVIFRRACNGLPNCGAGDCTRISVVCRRRIRCTC